MMKFMLLRFFFAHLFMGIISNSDPITTATSSHPSACVTPLNPLSISMESITSETNKRVYSVWALPPEDVAERFTKLMADLRSEFGGPEFKPHVTVVGAMSLTEADAREKLAAGCEGLKAYDATVEKVATGTFFYQCVFLLLRPDPQVTETAAKLWDHFGYKNSSAYMPHLSILYGDLSEEDKKKAQEKANILDDSLTNLSFQINRLALYETDTEDVTLKSWKKITEIHLQP